MIYSTLALIFSMIGMICGIIGLTLEFFWG